MKINGCLFASAMVLWHQVAAAQPFPSRPIRFLVPVPAGSTTDIVTRVVAQKMGEAWQQQVVVDNRPGGVMTIATDLVSKAPPDGHTIATLLTPTAVNPYVKIGRAHV